jgi:hypothetical protein
VVIAIHIVNTSRGDARQAYEAAWRVMDERGIPRHPAGQRSHTAWLVGDVLHVLNVWESEDDNNAFMQALTPILQELGLELDGPPEMGELLQAIQTPQ